VVLAAVVAGLVFVAGLVLQSVGFVLLGIGAFCCAVLAYRMRARRSRGPRVRKNGR
jgi:membrane protein implicated in regulation of membrane protease activity